MKTSWLENYISFTQEQESPQLFHYWCGLSVLASVIGRNIYLCKSYDPDAKLYPNLYVFLVAPSGKCRKGGALGMAYRIIKETGTKVYAEAITKRALTQTLADEVILVNKVPQGESKIVIWSEELECFLNKEAYAAGLFSLLTRLYDCVDEKTEILTEEGWKNVDSIKENDLALTLNINRNILEYKKINFVVKKEVDEVIRFKSRSINQEVTRKHRVLHKTRGGAFKFSFAEDLVDVRTEIIVPVSSQIGNKDIPLPDELIALTAWVITDSYVKGGYVEIYQNEKKIGKIIKILDALDFMYRVDKKYSKGDKRGEYIANYDGYRIALSRYNPYNEFVATKRVPQLYKEMSERQFNIFLENLAFGDGTNLSATQKILTTSSKELVNDLQELAVKNGWKSSYSTYKERNAYQMSFNKKDTTRITWPGISIREIGIERNIVRKPTKVWCLNTDNKTIVIRREGKVSITGNCPDKWEYTTASQGKDCLYNVCANIVGGTIPDWFRNLTTEVMRTGFLARIMIIAQTETPRREPGVRKNSKKLELLKKKQKELIEFLVRLKEVKKEVSLSNEAINLYESWYMDREGVTDERFASFYEREHDHLIKITILLAASYGDLFHSDVIGSERVKEALMVLEKVKSCMALAYMGIGEHIAAKGYERVLQQIRDAGGEAEHSLLLRKNWYHFDTESFKKVIDLLVDTNRIRVKITKSGKRVYVLVKERR